MVFIILLYPDDAKMLAAEQIGCRRRRKTAAGYGEQ